MRWQSGLISVFFWQTLVRVLIITAVTAGMDRVHDLCFRNYLQILERLLLSVLVVSSHLQLRSF